MRQTRDLGTHFAPLYAVEGAPTSPTLPQAGVTARRTVLTNHVGADWLGEVRPLRPEEVDQEAHG